MIVEFTVENFLSFKEPQTLSFIATSSKDLETHLFKTPDNKYNLLKSLVIYGANASGKSNLLIALDLFRDLILESSDNKGSDFLEDRINSFKLCSTCKPKPSKFSLTFYIGNIRFIYSFSVFTTHVEEESLIYYTTAQPKTAFVRKNGAIELKGDFKNKHNKSVAERTNKSVLFLSKGANENIEAFELIYEWIKKNLLVNISVNPNVSDTEKLIYEKPSYKEKVLQLLNNHDLCISDIQVKAETFAEHISKQKGMPEELKNSLIKDLKDEIILKTHTLHRTHENELVQFPLNLESTGTKKLYALSGMLLTGLDNGQMLAIDELSATLHTSVLKSIVKLFNLNDKNAQFIFTTHDTNLLNPEVFRKDQIIFINKNNEQASEVYKLSDFNPRSDGRENWELRYLSGVYGALPFILEDN